MNQSRKSTQEPFKIFVLLTLMFTDWSATSQQRGGTQMEATVSFQRGNLVWTDSSQGSGRARQFPQQLSKYSMFKVIQLTGINKKRDGGTSLCDGFLSGQSPSLSLCLTWSHLE